jgi:hypothetical protein
MRGACGLTEPAPQVTGDGGQHGGLVVDGSCRRAAGAWPPGVAMMLIPYIERCFQFS